MNAFLYLKRMVGGMRDNHNSWKNLVDLSKFLVDGLAERSDLPLVAHVDRKRDRAATLPLPLRVFPRVVVQVLRGALVAATDFDQVAEIDRCARRRRGHENIAYRVYILELTGGVENDLLLSSLERAARSYNVASTKNISKR